MSHQHQLNIYAQCSKCPSTECGNSHIEILLDKTRADKASFKSNLLIAPEHFDNESQRFLKSSGNKKLCNEKLDEVINAIHEISAKFPHASCKEIAQLYLKEVS